MYQALYRKYRPNHFDEVVGQDVIVKTLSNEILHNKLSHAYLFTGPRGTGKTSVAKIMAKTINCSDLNGFLPCNKCVSCTQIDKFQTTDIIEIDAASNNGVDEIRELKSKVNLVPSTSKYKIYIIDEVHMMTVGAFNALLKTLEEPPAHVIFILATTDPQKLPSTILSRCQRFDFKKISEPKIVENLKNIAKNEKLKVDEQILSEIARLADGGMRDAIGVLDQVIAYADDKITLKDVHAVNGTVTQTDLLTFIEAIFQNDLAFLFTSIDEYNASGKNLIKLTEETIMFLRNVLLFKTVPKYFGESIVNTTIYEKVSSQTDVANLLKLIQLFNSSLIEMKNTNNPKLILELVLIQLKPMNDDPILIQSVESTEILINPVIVKKDAVDNVVIEPISDILHKEEIKPLNIDQQEELHVPNVVDFDRIKQIRINNALADFNKKKLTEIKTKLGEIRSLVIVPKYAKIANLILDGDLKVFGNNNLLYVFNDDVSTENFNCNLIQIEEIINKNINENCKAVAINNDEWNIIKKEFNSKTKKYEYIEEGLNIQIFAKKKADSIKSKDVENDEIVNLFGNIVNYK